MKEETLEEFINSQPYYGHGTPEYLEGIEVGAKWQAERMYSEEDVIKIVEKSRETGLTAEYLLLTFKQQEQ
jgi:hypothetical protein